MTGRAAGSDQTSIMLGLQEQVCYRHFCILHDASVKYYLSAQHKFGCKILTQTQLIEKLRGTQPVFS